MYWDIQQVQNNTKFLLIQPVNLSKIDSGYLNLKENHWRLWCSRLKTILRY